MKGCKNRYYVYMRISELAQQSGVTVSTIKYYLREELLPAGKAIHPNQSEYTQEHLERLRLIRALSETAGLSLKKIREVLNALKTTSTPSEAMGLAQNMLVSPSGSPEENNPHLAERFSQAIAPLNWSIHPQSPAYMEALRAFSELERENLPHILERVNDYAKAADFVGKTDLQAISQLESTDELVRAVVLGTAFRKPLLDALILLSQQHYAQKNK
ncbi:MerR family transcriptional regulator [uncultured Rothia sp.]|uniref:MerR family transcriptional regulator n=1 Tax=uncultured Rothia sp. TaxID=316088 RepID=UPI0032171FE0